MSKRKGGGIFEKKQIANANQAVKFNTNSMKLYKTPKMNSTNQMAMRTGGWADPSRMTAERKFVDVQAGTLQPGTNNAWVTPVLLNGLATGTDASSRIGRKVTLSSILIRTNAFLNDDSTFGAPVRIMVFYDKQANATAVANMGPNVVLATDSFISPNELANRDRFVTIFDYIIPSLSVNGQRSDAKVLYKKLQLEMIFNSGTTAVIGSITTGAIYISASQGGVIGTNGPDIGFYSRIRYTDV